MNVADALRELDQERRRLHPSQGRIARRNARRGFLGAMKALRNALNAEFPRIERPQTSEKYVVDIFEKAHREGRRLLNDRWRVVRRLDFAGYTTGSLERFATFTAVAAKAKGADRCPLPLGALVPTDVRAATRLAVWCKKNLPFRTFRLRKVGEKEGLVVDVL